MKLQKLTIHNIASIENAIIDFEAQPLSSCEVFLICGRTGAGKSTILDAICLALYATTPRLENTNMQGESADADKEVKINDPRQLMRRNTGEAFVELTFTGSNGKHYEARWSVARARNKTNGNLQGKKWQLMCLDNNVTLSKDKEIEDEIQSAIGLGFSQFCRTTMLAQGEFTRFLDSKDKDKAEILEKITGVDIYSKIGKKVFEITSKKQQEWEDADRLVADIKIMSEEEIIETLSEIKKIEENQAKLNAERKSTETKLKWLQEDADLSQKVVDAKLKLHETAAKMEDEEFKDKENLVKQWNETIDSRGWLKELNTANQIIAIQNQTLADYELRYYELKGGESWLVAEAQKVNDKLQSLEKEIEVEKDKAYIYDNEQKITGLLEIIGSGIRDIDSKTISLKKAQKKLDGELTDNRKNRTDLYIKIKHNFEEQVEIQKSIEQNLADRKLPELRNIKEVRQQIITDTGTAIAKLELLAKELKHHNNLKRNIEEQEKNLSTINDELSALMPLIHDAQLRADTCLEVLEKHRESVDKWAKSMRSKLQVGDICPVCRQIIDGAIPHEDIIDEMYSVSEKTWKDADKRLCELKDREKELRSDIKSQTAMLAKATAEFETDRNLADCEDAAKNACEKCGVDSSDNNALAILTSNHDEALAKIEVINGKIEEAEEVEINLLKSRAQTERIRKVLENAKTDMENAICIYEKCQSEINTIKNLIDAKREEISTASDKVNAFLGESQLISEHTADIENLIDRLKTSTTRYKNLITDHQNLQQDLNTKKTLINHVAQPLAAIRTLLPMWSQSISKPKEINGLIDESNNLRTTIHTAIEQRTSAENVSANAKSRLKSFLVSNPEMNLNKLTDIDKYSAAAIAKIVKDISEIREEMVSRKSIFEQFTKQQSELSSRKPKLEEEDSSSLKEKIGYLDKEHSTLGEKKGALNLLLRQDETNKKRKADLLADVAEKKGLFERWSRINQLIGDSTGSKFRKIAQSYVLNNLVHSANTYMRTLTDRYTLKVEPGTFVIMLEDAYQGYVSRAASTISGGEGFLVSLALALALSDIGTTLSVDTLFIDEGFGTLSGEPLQKAIDTLRNLHHKSARNVGIISHVEELRERIPVQIQVLQEDNTSSSKVLILPKEKSH